MPRLRLLRSSSASRTVRPSALGPYLFCHLPRFPHRTIRGLPSAPRAAAGYLWRNQFTSVSGRPQAAPPEEYGTGPQPRLDSETPARDRREPRGGRSTPFVARVLNT